ncbi:hypothetical protein ACFW9I_31595 [[Kitasatospora] papulosa]|uniref:hypothetical protein n=1 Tax=[Kitasatospora] papulosa TaxID=1464011 RepID=UPI0036BB9DB3
MTRDPNPAEAARALRDVDERRGQALGSSRDARWVAVFFSIAIFVLLAAPDFFGEDVQTWTSVAFAVATLAYAVLLRTRRGAVLLGRRTQLRADAVPSRFALVSRLVILALCALGVVGAFLAPSDPSVPVPYWRTAVGAALGGVLIFFGDRIQQELASLAANSAARDRARRGTL